MQRWSRLSDGHGSVHPCFLPFSLRLTGRLRYPSSMDPLGYLEDELRSLEAVERLRREAPAVPSPPRECSNDYLGLARHAVTATDGPTTVTATGGAGASRLVLGTREEHCQLEEALAQWLCFQAALTFTSGYAANVGVLSALGAVPQTTLFSDELNHASIVDGCRLARAPTVVYPHLDLAALEVALAATRGRRIVVSESYFSMDGTSPDFPALASVCARHDAALVVDEAHALGVFGPSGRGLAAHHGVMPDILVGTFGKAVGLQGAFAASTEASRQWLWNHARSFGYSTALSPILAALALHRVIVVQKADGLRAHVHAVCGAFEEALAEFHVKLDPHRHGPIFPIVVGSESHALALQAHLDAAGVSAVAIRPPTVPENRSRLRVTVTAAWTPTHAREVAQTIATAWTHTLDES